MHQLALEFQRCNGLGRLTKAHLQGQGRYQLNGGGGGGGGDVVQGNVLLSCPLQACSRRPTPRSHKVPQPTFSGQPTKPTLLRVVQKRGPLGMSCLPGQP